MNSNIRALNKALGITDEMIASKFLLESHEASILEIAEIGSDGRKHMLVPAAACAWRSLRQRAQADGIDLFIVSAFRSIARQAEILHRKVGQGVPIAEAITVCAPPGFSEHHTGCAVDISSPDSPLLEIEFEQSPAFIWLCHHAHEFGFHLSYPMANPSGYQYEPWHWCFQPSSLSNHCLLSHNEIR